MSAPKSPRELRIAIIGAGPGGLCMAIQLKRAGFHDFVILEQSEGVGGTWMHNTYPGCACDLPSHLYSYSFEQRPDWPRPYSPQAEIKTYIDNARIWTLDISDTRQFHEPHFLLLNLAVGGEHTGILDSADITAPFPAEYRVDYIRIFYNGFTVLGDPAKIDN